MVKVPSQTTGLTFSSYGEISVRDVAEWQNDESFSTAKFTKIIMLHYGFNIL